MTKALILAAGQGTRLRPITNERPKCLVPLLGKTLLERQVKTLGLCGVNDIHVVTGYRADQIEKLGFSTSLNERFEQTNMVESLFSAIEFIQGCEEDLIISYGDIVYQKNNLQKLLQSNEEISLMVDESWLDLWSARLDNPLTDAETMIINERGYVEELGKKPNDYSQIHAQYTGLIKVSAKKIQELVSFYLNLDREKIYDENDFYNMYMTSFIQELINNDWMVKAVKVNHGWLEIDSVQDLECYETMESEGKLNKIFNSEL